MSLRAVSRDCRCSPKPAPAAARHSTRTGHRREPGFAHSRGQVLPGKQLVQTAMRADRPSQPKGCECGLQVADCAPRSTSAEVSVDGIKDRPEMFAKHAIGSRQLKASNIDKAHQLGILRHHVHHKLRQHGDHDFRLQVRCQTVLELPTQLQAGQSGFGSRQKQIRSSAQSSGTASLHSPRQGELSPACSYLCIPGERTAGPQPPRSALR